LAISSLSRPCPYIAVTRHYSVGAAYGQSAHCGRSASRELSLILRKNSHAYTLCPKKVTP